MIQLTHALLLTLGLAWLFLWRLVYPSVSCLLSVIFISPILALIAFSMWESASMRRQAAVSMYLLPEGWVYRLFSGGFFLTLWQFSKATLLAFFLVFEALFWDYSIWIALLIDGFFIASLHYYLSNKLKSQVKPGYVNVFARESLVIINSLVFALLVSILGMNLEYPNYRELSWFQTIEYEVTKVEGSCHVTLVLARIAAAKNAIGWWLAEAWLTKVADIYLAFVAWFIFMLNSSAFIWAYSRMSLGILSSFERHSERH